jgi:hypothetical protein
MQGDKEKECNLKCSPFMERGNSSLAQMELNFIDYLIVPFVTTLAELLPEMKHLLNTLKNNRAHWEDLLEQEKRAELLTLQSGSSSSSSSSSSSVSLSLSETSL